MPSRAEDARQVPADFREVRGEDARKPRQHESRHKYADMVLRRNGNAAREAKQQEQQAAVRHATVDESTDNGNRDRYPANDLEWIHCYPP